MSQPKKLGSELLFVSISNGDMHNVIHLLEEDEVDVNNPNINGQTALHFAVLAQNLNLIGLLLDYQAEPNVKDNFEIGFNTPLHIAADLNMINALELFLEKGGDATIPNK